jgi:ComF family protein
MQLLDVVLPPACGGCGRYGNLLCEVCLASLRPASNELHRFLATDGGVVIGEKLELARAAFVYEGPMRRALSRLKYGGAARLARPLAESAALMLPGLLALGDVAALVPVPVHADRLRQRGYNQAALIADRLARAVGIPLLEVLVRRRPTTQQHRLDRVARLRNLRGAFAVASGRRPPSTVVVVDDILTTAATLESCATVLREAGAERVLGFAIAREI